MGKLIRMISILIFIDLLFIITGQLTLNSPTSAIIQAILDPANIQSSQLWTLLIISGISILSLTTAVVVGIVTRNLEFFFFVTISLGFATLVGDFVTIFVHLASFNIVLATLIMGPIIILFVFTVLEWLRGKD